MSFVYESTHVPSAMKSPSRNIPISTVSVAAIAVERFDWIEPERLGEEELRPLHRSGG